MNNNLTTEEKRYLRLHLKCDGSDEDVVKVIEERKKTVELLLMCLDDEDEHLLNSYRDEKICLDNIEKKIKGDCIEKEIMKNALDMYIRDTSEKIIFIHDNMGNDNGLMKHFIEMVDIAKGMKMKL